MYFDDNLLKHHKNIGLNQPLAVVENYEIGLPTILSFQKGLNWTFPVTSRSVGANNSVLKGMLPYIHIQIFLVTHVC